MRRRDLMRNLAAAFGGALTGCGGRSGVARATDDPRPSAGGVCAPTRGDVLGPYYTANAPMRATIAATSEAGERLRIVGRVIGPDCRSPIAGAMLDVWQADARGNYYDCPNCDLPDDSLEEFRLRGIAQTNAVGEFEIGTIKPGHYRLSNGWRPAHVHFRIAAHGFATLTTQLYFAGDPHLAPNDACGSGCGSDDPGRIVALRGVSRGLEAAFPIVLRRA